MSMSGRGEPEAGTAPAQGALANSLDQVRDILFGSQHREFARRLARTDAHLAAQAEELRSETRRRLDVLEAHVRDETRALAASIESQRAAEIEAVDKATLESRGAIGALEQRVKRLEETLSRAQHDLREMLLQQAKSFIDEVQRTRDELRAAVEREVVFHEAGEGSSPEETAPEEPARRERAEPTSKAA